MNPSNESIIKGEIGKSLEGTLAPFIQSVMLSDELPGLAIGMVAGGETVYARGFGVQSVETQEPVTMTTLFHMASISKPFSATALMQLAEKGQVQLDAPVVTYLPYFKLDDERCGGISVQHMLSHVSGMPDVEDYEWDRPQYDDGALERYVRSLTSKKLLFEPGQEFAYSNMAFECLGDVIAKISGTTFDDYIKEHILDPAGMVESTFLKPAYLPKNWAAPHVFVLDRSAWGGYPYNRMHGPSSTLHSNALEMCNWAITNLQRGSFAGRQILDQSSYDVLWQPRVDASDGRQVGLSWFLEAYRGEKCIQHGGGDTGFATHFTLLPDKQAAVVVLCNMIPAPVEELAHSALDILLGYQPTPVRPYACMPVFKTLAGQGLDAAAAHWNWLKASQPDDYDFGGTQFDMLYNAMSLDQVQPAELIARLCARTLPEAELKAIEADFARYSCRAAAAIVRAIRGCNPERH